MEKLAKAILMAAKLHEGSYDYEVANKIEEGISTTDYNQFYKLPLRDACDKAAEQLGLDTKGTPFIYLLLKNSWNDALEWAKSVIK